MRVAVVHTVPGEVPEDHRAEWLAAAGAGTELTVSPVAEGPSAILDEDAVAAIEPFVRAEVCALDGAVDAVIVGCFADPGLVPARAESDVPVYGVAESTMLTAARSVERFAVVTVVEPELLTELARRAGIGDQLVSVTRIATPPARLRTERETVVGELIRHSRAAVEAGAEAICLGCCSFAGLSEAVGSAVGVPVLDPKTTTLRYVEAAAAATT